MTGMSPRTTMRADASIRLISPAPRRDASPCSGLLRLLLVLTVGALLPLLAVQPPIALADSKTFTVNTTSDGLAASGTPCDSATAGQCTLRQALKETEALPFGSDATIIVPAGTYNLTVDVHPAFNAPGGLQLYPPHTLASVTIRGAGAGQTIVDGQGKGPVFQNGVKLGNAAGSTVGQVSIEGLTIRNGHMEGSGAGIRNYGTMTVRNSTIRDNTGVGYANGEGLPEGEQFTGGAGIFNRGTLTVINSSLLNNSADFPNGGGGALHNFSGSTMTVIDSTISGNSTTGQGGAIYLRGGLTVTGSTLNSNSAPSGGTIMEQSGPVTISNTTLSGGGTWLNGDATVSNTTFNESILPGGSYTGTIFAGSCAGTGLGSDSGYNLDAGTDCRLTAPTSLSGQDPKLAPLADNGGPTQTMALLPGSAAIDGAGTPASNPACTGNDQRAVSRPRGSACDIGAFESPVGVSTLRVSLSGGGQSGARINVPAGTAVTSQATLSNLTANAGGTVAYNVYTDSGCTQALAGAASQKSVTNGSVPAATPVTLNSSSPTGHYYFQAAYSGDAGNQPATSLCTAAVATVPLTYTVNTTTDQPTSGAACAASTPNQCTIRQALSEAEALPEGSGATVVVPAGTYNLTSGTGLRFNPTATQLTLTIQGEGAGKTIVDGLQHDSVLTTSAGVVSIGGLTIRGGTTSNGAAGGGISNTTNLTVHDTEISGNAHTGAGAGGGIVNFGGTVTLVNSLVTGNSSSLDGAGIFNSNAATFTILNSTVTGNGAGRSGGGIANGGTLKLTFTTVVGNSAVSGGGINADTGTVTLAETIVARNTGGDCGSHFTDGGYNLDGDGSCGLSAANHSLPNTNPIIGTLGNYGGPTRTVPILPGSPAVDAAGTTQTNQAACTGTDQRGMNRPIGSACDIGALELNPGISGLGLTLNGAGKTGPSINVPVGTAVTNQATLLNVTTNAGGSVSYNVYTDGGCTQVLAGATSQKSVTNGSVPAADPVSLANPVSYYFQAAYSGDANNLAATSGCGTSIATVSGAPTFIVDTTTDIPTPAGTPCASATAGQCSLRQAINETNGLSAGSAVTITVPAGTYNLTRTPRPLLQPSATLASVTVHGAGAGQTIIDGQAHEAILVLTASAGRVTVSGVTMRNGASSVGGIENFGTLTLIDSAITGNRNSSFNPGGGIFNEGSLTLTRVTLSGNQAGGGAGIYAHSSSSAVAIDSSTISGNTGGAILVDAGTVTVTNSTISGNTASSASGNVHVDGGSLTLSGSIIAGNTGGDCGGSIVDGGYNLDGDGSCGFSAAKHSLSKSDPKLGILADNGGTTQTMALQAGSPAIEAGGSTATNPLCTGTDQRGTARPIGSACDIGAYEAPTSALPSFGLTVALASPGSGTVASNPTGIACGSTCTATFASGTPVTLTATAATGSIFTGWSGACIGTGSCQVTMDQARTVTATFGIAPSTVNLTVTKAGQGTGMVTSNPAGIACGADCTESYLSGTQVTLTASAATDAIFTGWSGACTGTGTCQVTMDQVRSVTATFGTIIPTALGLTVTKAGDGTGTVTSNPTGITCGPDCTEAYGKGTDVTLTATPESGSKFTGWSGVCTGTGACSVTIDGAASVTATFDRTRLTAYTLTVSRSGTGSGTVTSTSGAINCGSSCGATLQPGSQITLTAVPSQGNELSEFVRWGGVCSSAGSNPICQLDISPELGVDPSILANVEFRRVNVGVQVGRQPGLSSNTGPALAVTLTARAGCGSIEHIVFGEAQRSFNNAQVAVVAPSGGPTGQTTGFTYTPPAGTTSVSLTLQRVSPTGGATISPVHLFDGCGEWRTFFGGGPDAFR